MREGQDAPDFALPDQDGNEVTLSELRGQTVVLYFFPKADTPGCTAQACGVREHRSDYEGTGARVVGVSPDTVTAERKFADKYGLDFTLLADENHEVADLYGVWGEKQMYGKTYMGVSRTTFLIDPEGKVARVFPKVSPKTHDEVVLEALADVRPQHLGAKAKP
jgi:peroxiredoxin Q/BCP